MTTRSMLSNIPDPPTVSGTARKVFALLDRLSDDDRHRVISAVVALYTSRERVDGTA